MDINKYISSGIIEMYVMGLCNSDEKTELEELRKIHPVLNEAILKYEVELQKKLFENIILPTEETDKIILQNFRSLKSPVIVMNEKNVKNVNWVRIVAAAAVILFLVSASFNYFLFSKYKRQELAFKAATENVAPPSLPLADFNIMKNPAITPVAMYGVGYHAICRCTMFWDKKTGKVYIMIHHLPLSSESRDYQLWANVNGKQVSIGIIKDEIRDRFIEMKNVPSDAASFIVTLENAGGAVIPTIEETYLSGKI
jgi:hypothetical protein